MLIGHFLQLVNRHYERILAQWPVDALRPNVSFEKAMRRRIARRLEPANATPEINVVAKEAQASVPVATKFNEQAELEQVNALYSFLENRYSQKVRASSQDQE